MNKDIRCILQRLLQIAMVIAFLLSGHDSHGQPEASHPNLDEFFERLRTIKPNKEKLVYDTFPDFDFVKFVPLEGRDGSRKISYIVGSTPDKTIRSIILQKDNRALGTMNVYNFNSFKIVTFKKTEAILTNKYPDFPIFCISRNSRFIVYLAERFQYQKAYDSNDIASIQILRDDLFPVFSLSITNSAVQMLFSVDYVKSAPNVIDRIRAMMFFHPESDENLLISRESRFSEELLIPDSDFMVTLHPAQSAGEIPYWILSNGFIFE